MRDHDVERRSGDRDRRSQRDQYPGGDVVERGGGQHHRADRALEHAALDEDSRQHREGGDRHRDARRTGRTGRKSVSGASSAVDRQRDRDAEHHRQRHAGVRDQRDLARAPADLARVELEPDQEHVEDQPELGGHLEVGNDVLGKERLGGRGRDRPEQRRAQGEAGHDLADHPRLPDRHGGHAEQSCEDASPRQPR